MATKRQKKTQADPRASAVDAALRLAALRGWEAVSLREIAQEAGMALADLAHMFECREDVLAAYGRRVDADVLAAFAPSGSAHEDVLDILMERFERLNRDRAAVVSILDSFRCDPKQAVIALPHLGKSMTWMLEACGIDTLGPRGALRVAGLTGVYLWILRTWRADDSPDLARTMAALDRALGHAGRLAGTLGL